MTSRDLWRLATHAFWDTLPMVPILLVLYTALELLSHREGSRLTTRAWRFGPIAGALLGVIPQCGMSVFVTSLFLGGRVTAGTLIATYLATSDEAIPVLLASGEQLGRVGVLVVIKCLVGIVSGFLVDAFPPRWGIQSAPQTPRSWVQLHVETEMHHAPFSRTVIHSGRRTLEIFAWVFGITVVLGVVIERVGLERIALASRQHPTLELLGAALFGLIPNCSASVAIAEGYLHGVLSFGATVAGLCAGAGYGPILLLRRGLLQTAVRVLALCLFFSIAAGIVVSMTPLGR